MTSWHDQELLRRRATPVEIAEMIDALNAMSHVVGWDAKAKEAMRAHAMTARRMAMELDELREKTRKETTR